MVILTEDEEMKNKSVLHQDFGEVLKKRYHISVFNLLLIIVTIFVAAFFAGNQTAGVFQLSPKAFFRVGGGTQQGGFSAFSPPTPTITPVPTVKANCEQCVSTGCPAGICKQQCLECGAPTATTVPSPTTTANCATCVSTGCPAGICKQQCLECGAPTATKVPTPTVEVNCVICVNTGCPSWACYNQCTDCTVPPGGVTATKKPNPPTATKNPNAPSPTNKPGAPSATPTTVPAGGSCSAGFNLANCTTSGGGCCAHWGVGPSCSQYDADRHFEYCKAKCGFGGNPNACGGDTGPTQPPGGDPNAGKCGDPGTPKECCNKGNTGGGCVSKSVDCEAEQVSFGQAGCGGGQICCGN